MRKRNAHSVISRHYHLHLHMIQRPYEMKQTVHTNRQLVVHRLIHFKHEYWLHDNLHNVTPMQQTNFNLCFCHIWRRWSTHRCAKAVCPRHRSTPSSRRFWRNHTSTPATSRTIVQSRTWHLCPRSSTEWSLTSSSAISRSRACYRDCSRRTGAITRRRLHFCASCPTSTPPPTVRTSRCSVF